MRALVVVVAATACGRISFDPLAHSNADGALDATSTLTETFIKPPNGGQLFGWSVALSGDGNTLVVGARGDNSGGTGVGADPHFGSLLGSGAVSVYTRTGATWALQAFIKASNPDPGDLFGYCVALSPDASTLVVGAPGEASAATSVNGNQADNTKSMAGAAYVFKQTGAVWTQAAYLKAPNTDASDELGSSCAISGTTVAIGATGEASSSIGNQADNSMAGAGAVYIFDFTGSQWIFSGYNKAPNPSAGDNYGFSLAFAVAGNRLAVGAPGEASAAIGIDGNELDNSATSAGAVYVFDSGNITHYLKAPNTQVMQQLGSTVAMSGDGKTLVTGAPNESSRARGIDGNPFDTTSPNAGAAYLFTNASSNAGTWLPGAYVKASNGAALIQFGTRVAMSSDGSTFAVSAPFENGSSIGIDGDQAGTGAIDSGAVYTFASASGVVTQAHYLKAAFVHSPEQLGVSLALSADGSALAIGAPFDATNAEGIEPDPTDQSAPNSGAVFVIRPFP